MHNTPTKTPGDCKHVFHELQSDMIEIRQTALYASWFSSLRDRAAKARIDIRIRRLSLGNPGDVKPVGEGVSELRIDYGPGYRAYFVQRERTVIVLLAAGDKTSQDRDIKKTLELAREIQEIIMKNRVKTMPCDPSKHLETEADMAAYLEAAFEEGDPALVATALGDIARAKGMAQIARDTGLRRESLYKALSSEGNPEFATIMKVVGALGLKLHASPSV